MSLPLKFVSVAHVPEKMLSAPALVPVPPADAVSAQAPPELVSVQVALAVQVDEAA